MEQHNKEKIAQLVKEGRTAKGYTQQEVSDKTGISLRSVQRIENAEVLPRLYTINLLAQHLGFELKPDDLPAGQVPPVLKKLNKPRKIILTAGIGALMLIGTGAFISQSAHFPETSFEVLLLWGGVAIVYMAMLYKIWK